MTASPSPRTRRSAVLMVAYHFPPLAGSSGIQRTLRFVQHLPSFGWQPLVLTTSERAYERVSPDQLQDIPQGTVVRRAFALDAARHLSIAGRYLAATARPDRWTSWRFDGVRQGMQLIHEHRPAALWSTFPFATAHLIGAELARRSGLPWIADFRDPMAQDDYPQDPVTRDQFFRIEREVVMRAAFCVFTTEGAAQDARRRHPQQAHKMTVIENGYDEETFAQAESDRQQGPLHPDAMTLLHSGVVYESERDPTQLFAAVQRLKRSGVLQSHPLRIRFRASSADDLLMRLARTYDVEDVIEVAPPIPYRHALAEMMRADGLLILQAANCNHQIPAKLYEYLRSGRPIICLSDQAGDTWRTLNRAGLTRMADLTNASAIALLLEAMLGSGSASNRSDDALGLMASPQAVTSASRRQRTNELATILLNATDEFQEARSHA